MADSLRLARDFALPLETITQSIGILAKRRAGKSYTAARLTEQVLHAKQQVVIVDPKGDWWGVRSSASGKGPGFPIVILGGEHGDVPLASGDGETVAAFIVEERVSVLLDLSSFRKSEVATFMAGFLETLYRLKAREQHRTPVLLVIDEADAIAPQRPQPNEARMLGAAEDIVRRGGQRGIGCAMVTQRAAVLNKNVLTQVQVLICLRTIAPQDLKAINDWIDVHGTPEQRERLMASLPSLPVGTAWVWSPGWPTEDGIFRRVEIAKRETYDSGATPKPGETRLPPRTLADVDLDALRGKMAEMVERKKADDPKVLRARIAELERKQAAPKVEVQTIEKVVEVPALSPDAEQRLTAALAQAEAIARELRETLSHARPTAPAPRPVPAPKARAAPPSGDGEKLGKAERLILSALAQYPQGRSKVQIALLAGYAHSGGSFNNAIGALRSKGYAEGGGDNIRITDAGLAALGTWEPLPTGRALADHWLSNGQLGKAEKLILGYLIDQYPQTATKQEVGEATGYEPSGGSFNNALGRLRTLELITRGSEMRASEDFFQ